MQSPLSPSATSPTLRLLQTLSQKGALGGVEIVLLDMGGVMASDYHEVLWQMPDALADHFGLPPRHVGDAVMQGLWHRLYLAPSTLEAYCAGFSHLLGVEVTPDLVRAREPYVDGNPHSRELLALFERRGLKIGLLSDNTSTSYPVQVEAIQRDAGIDIRNRLDPDWILLSHKTGLSKSHTAQSSFALVAQRTDPARVLFIDDRQSNVDLARQHGLKSVLLDRATTLDEAGYYRPGIY